MRWEIRHDPRLGRLLWLTDGRTELAAPLDLGIRISHLSHVGMENLFYEQPADADYLTTPSGWRVYGGHRFWTAPESDENYYPDNDPVDYELLEDGVWLHQREDAWQHVQKSLRLRFLAEGKIEVRYQLKNTAAAPRTCALWGVSTVAAGGQATVPFGQDPQTPYNPSRTVALWADTDLHDPRLHFTGEALTANFLPLDAYLKLGLSARPGRAELRNRGQLFVKEFPREPEAAYPDGGSNFELYLCRHMMELETLGPLRTLPPAATAHRTEYWTVTADTAQKR